MKRDYRDADGNNNRIVVDSWKVWHELSDDGGILTLKGEWNGDSRFDGVINLEYELLDPCDGKDYYGLIQSTVHSDLPLADHIRMVQNFVSVTEKYLTHFDSLLINVD